MVNIVIRMSDDEVEEFLTGENQMGLNAPTYKKLMEQGIKTPIDLIDFDKEGIDKVAEVIRKTIEKKDQNFVGAKSQKRLAEAADLVRFYNEIGRNIDSDSLDYDSVIRDFTKQWNAIKENKEAKDSDVPKILKSLPTIKWIEAFDDHLSMVIGVRNIPLSYVTRLNVASPDEIEEREEGKAHSIGSSVVEDLVVHADQRDAYFKTDNQRVYHLLEKATR